MMIVERLWCYQSLLCLSSSLLLSLEVNNLHSFLTSNSKLRTLWPIRLCKWQSYVDVCLLLVAAGTVRSVIGPFVEIVKSLNLPDWLVHWGHPGNMVKASLLPTKVSCFLTSFVSFARYMFCFRWWICSCFVTCFFSGSGSFCYGWIWNIPRLQDSLFRWHCKNIFTKEYNVTNLQGPLFLIRECFVLFEMV